VRSRDTPACLSYSTPITDKAPVKIIETKKISVLGMTISVDNLTLAELQIVRSGSGRSEICAVTSFSNRE